MTELHGWSTLDGITQLVTLNEAIADLTYINYRHNRRLAPNISPESWAKIYADAKSMEARYQAEISEGITGA